MGPSGADRASLSLLTVVTDADGSVGGVYPAEPGFEPLPHNVVQLQVILSATAGRDYSGAPTSIYK